MELIKTKKEQSAKESVIEEKINEESLGLPPVIGADNITIKVGEVEGFDPLEGVVVSEGDLEVTGNIEKPEIGSNKEYVLTYVVTDEDGKVTKIERIVTVTNQKPVIEGLGDLKINKGETINIKDGVTAKDNEDGDKTSEIVYPSNDLTKLDVGSHTIEYSVTDSDGNMTVQKRNIIIQSQAVVEDKIDKVDKQDLSSTKPSEEISGKESRKNGQPSIFRAPTIYGIDDITIKMGEVDNFNANLLNGVRAGDMQDAPNEIKLEVSGTVAKPAPGETLSSVITYTATDTDNNPTVGRRTVTVINKKPTFTIANEFALGKVYIPMNGTNVNMPNMYRVQFMVEATDHEDGDIELKHQVNFWYENGAYVQTNKADGYVVGKHTVRVDDSDRNKFEKEFDFIIDGSPRISGVSNHTMRAGQDFNQLAGITANDVNQGDLTSEIVVTGDIDTDTPGTYTLTYTVSDWLKQKATATRTVVVETNEKAVITGADDVTIKANQVAGFNPLTGVTATDDNDTDLEIVVIGAVQKPAAGTNQDYVLTYTVTDSDGNITTATRNIEVVSNTAADIIGAEDIEIGVGEVDLFNPLEGITVEDYHDSILPENIVVSGTVEKPEAGTNKDYTITYVITDSDGNKTELNRIVKVTNQLPTISGLTKLEMIQGGVLFTRTVPNLMDGIVGNDYEDGVITDSITPPTQEYIKSLPVGVHDLEYIIIDTDGNEQTLIREIEIIAHTNVVLPGQTDDESDNLHIVTPGGFSVDLDGNITVSDGNLGIDTDKDSDINLELPEGTLVSPDSTYPLAVVTPGETFELPEGTIIKPGGTFELPNGVVINPSTGEVTTPGGGTYTNPDGTVTLPDGSKNPETGDVGTAGYVSLGLASIAGLIGSKNKNKNKAKSKAKNKNKDKK